MTRGDALAARFCAEVAADDAVAADARTRFHRLMSAGGKPTRDPVAVSTFFRGLPGNAFRILTRVTSPLGKIVLSEWRIAPGDWSENLPEPAGGVTIVLHTLTVTRRGADLGLFPLVSITRHALSQWFAAAPDPTYPALFADLSPLVTAEDVERVACPSGEWWLHVDRRNATGLPLPPLRCVRTYARSAAA
ncbi:MAG: hypothetical protein HIU82_12545 [Proteobacteria bacterium]|nr:hypothetical protein [Pseudomonadota bacterium]